MGTSVTWKRGQSIVEDGVLIALLCVVVLAVLVLSGPPIATLVSSVYQGSVGATIHQRACSPGGPSSRRCRGLSLSASHTISEIDADCSVLEVRCRIPLRRS
jgi:hypothetical protein